MSIGAKKCILFIRREEAPVSRCCALRLIRLIPPHCSATERAKRGAPPRRGQTIPVLPAWISRIPQLPLIRGYGISLERISLNPTSMTAAQIAERTFLSVHTVNTHRQRIYGKMDVRSVTDMIHKASELGIV